MVSVDQATIVHDFRSSAATWDQGDGTVSPEGLQDREWSQSIILKPEYLMAFTLLGSGPAWDLSLISSFQFPPFEMVCLSYVCPTTVFWNHKTCLLSQVHRGEEFCFRMNFTRNVTHV